MGLRHFFLCMLLLLASVPASAVASGWSGLGGGAGRSGHDAFDHGATTNVLGSWSQIAALEQKVIAGPVISDGVPGTERVVYGTALDALHVQMLSKGMEVGPQPGHDIDGGVLDSDTFGGGDAVASPVPRRPCPPDRSTRCITMRTWAQGSPTSRSRRSTSPPAPSCGTCWCPGPTAMS